MIENSHKSNKLTDIRKTCFRYQDMDVNHDNNKYKKMD